eukprot:TRINITY_DN7490_c0_g1_i1.p1 TRINITY_DN7490_c0_g1~~TRINITY_DN7490_c0_g1_i1.p1  ORF type:complete len:290 (+),score=46.98 TRINITY_DN7490_c0_g1_i1:193-1062(+)
MHQSSCTVFVTGAGISTNARIRDYRGPEGIWTQAAKAGISETEASLNMVWDDALYQSIPAARPTLVHRSMAALVNAEKVVFVISQNEDGLHVRAGHPRHRLAELHGNDYVEICHDCGRESVRDFVTYYKDTYKETNPLGQHVTGRKCSDCGGKLLDTAVNFGETPCGEPWGHNMVHNMVGAIDAMRSADLVVVWGSSLGVVANYFDPWEPKSKWSLAEPAGPRPKGLSRCKLAIVNQGQVVDQELAELKLDLDVDEAMVELLNELGVDSPSEYDPARDPILTAAEAVRG